MGEIQKITFQGAQSGFQAGFLMSKAEYKPGHENFRYEGTGDTSRARGGAGQGEGLLSLGPRALHSSQVHATFPFFLPYMMQQKGLSQCCKGVT